jgi:hypothetical protein
MSPVQAKSAPLRPEHVGAVIWFAGRMSTVSCRVREISEAGCRLNVDRDVFAPDKFELVLGEGAIIEQCELVSREDDEMAVRFIRSDRPEGAA